MTALELRELVSSTTTRSVSATFSFSITARGGYRKHNATKGLACKLTFLTAVLLVLTLVEGVACADLRDGVGDFDKLDIADTL